MNTMSTASVQHITAGKPQDAHSPPSPPPPMPTTHPRPRDTPTRPPKRTPPREIGLITMHERTGGDGIPPWHEQHNYYL